MLCLFTANCWRVKAQNSEPKIQIQPIIGYQQEHFDWSIAGNTDGNSPNILSELIWKNLQMQRVGLAIKAQIWKGIYVRAQVDQMSILAGKANDSDYANDNRARTPDDYSEDFESNQGVVNQWEAGLGYTLYLNKRWSISPYISYKKKQQMFYLLDFNANQIPLNQAQQRSTYATQWSGWALAIVPKYQYQKWTVMANIQYQQLKYNADANWVLITTFAHPVSYEHWAKGYGIHSEMKITYDIFPEFSISISGLYGKQTTGEGVDKLNYASTGSTSVFTQMNGANSRYFGAYLGLGFKIL